LFTCRSFLSIGASPRELCRAPLHPGNHVGLSEERHVVPTTVVDSKLAARDQSPHAGRARVPEPLRDHLDREEIREVGHSMRAISHPGLYLRPEKLELGDTALPRLREIVPLTRKR
jgi:hypothetical protein